MHHVDPCTNVSSECDMAIRDNPCDEKGGHGSSGYGGRDALGLTGDESVEICVTGWDQV